MSILSSLIDLRKLIKYEETLGINVNQENYFENLFKRTTASFRAKVGKENVRCDRVVRENKRDHDQHVLRPLNQLAQHQQAESRAAMAKKGPQTQTARTYTKSRSGINLDGGGGMLRSDNKNHQSQHQPLRSGRSRNSRNLENLSREQAWQSDKRIPFGECPEPRGPQPEAAERDTKRASKETTAGRERSPKGTQQTTGSRAMKTGNSKSVSGATARDGGDSQRTQAAAVARDAIRGRARARHPNHERGATARSPSASSYATARSVGVIIPRHCTTTRRRRPLSTDPVALYHYYQSEWNYFRQQIPGESSHADLRWLIRTRLMDPN